MSEYTLQIPDDLLTTVQQLAAQQRVSVNQLLISMIKNNVDKSQASWENYFSTARKAPDEFMADVIDELPQQ